MEDRMTEDQARAICAERGATFSIKMRSGRPYVYVARWVPSHAASARGYTVHKGRGQSFDRYVCPLAALGQLDEPTLRLRIAALPVNPNQRPTTGHQHDQAAGECDDQNRTKGRMRTPGRDSAASAVASSQERTPDRVFFDLLATIPTERTGIRIWAKAARNALALPQELLMHRLVRYRTQLVAAGVRLAQSTRYNTLCIPDADGDDGRYYSHIWRES